MFNDEGKITQYDAQLVRSSWIFPTVLPLLVPRLAKELKLPVSTDPLKLATMRAAVDICSAHDAFCKGENKQYNATSQCMNFILNQIPLGDIWQAGQNTGICRYLHKGMVCIHLAVFIPWHQHHLGSISTRGTLPSYRPNWRRYVYRYYGTHGKG